MNINPSIRPLTTLTNVAPSQVIPNAIGAGVIPVGNFKGNAAFWNLDMAVNQPLVWAEQLSILGNIDGAGATGLVLMTTGALAAGLVVSGTITVPAGQVWYINAIVGTCVADATGTIVYNWRCSVFPDALANPLGGVYHTAWTATPLAPLTDEFSIVGPLFAIVNKPVALRLPALSTISGQLMNAGAVAATGVVGTFQLYGYVGKALVL